MYLYIEMYMVQTYRYTTYEWHRLGNHAENVCFMIEGTIQSNNGQWISLVAGAQPMTHLWWQENIFGNANHSGGPGRDIPISWEAQWGNGLVYGQEIQEPWAPKTPPDVSILIPVPCDHWYQFKGCFDLEYHEHDGMYCLTLEGCPSPNLSSSRFSGSSGDAVSASHSGDRSNPGRNSTIHRYRIQHPG